MVAILIVIESSHFTWASQISTMYYESYCDLLVFFDPQASSLFTSQLLYYKDWEARDYSQQPLSHSRELVHYCSHRNQ
mgnify:FL=1